MSEYRTAGDKFINSDEFRSYNGAGASSRVDVELRAPINTTDEPGSAWVRPDRLVAPSAGFATPLLNAFNRIVVSSNSIEWVTTGLAPEADIVPEGDEKPEATLISSLDVINLSTIAHFVSATRQVLEDSPALRSYIDTMLMQGVYKKLDAVAGAALTGATLPTAEGADLISAVRVGIGTVQEAGFNPGLVVLNPSDYAAMDVDMLSKTLDGDRIRGTYWGLEVVASSQVTAGTAYVGDFGAGTAFFDRNVASLYVTDSHAENFTSNIITILGEARAAAVISNVNAFAECTVEA